MEGAVILHDAANRRVRVGVEAGAVTDLITNSALAEIITRVAQPHITVEVTKVDILLPVVTLIP